MQERRDSAPCYRDYVIKDGVFVGKFEEMYRDVPDPWGCVEKAHALQNRLFLDLLHEQPPGGHALDVGCGLGSLAAQICKVVRPIEMSAFDVSLTAIEKARATVQSVHFFVHDLVKEPILPFSAGYFSLVTVSEVIWYILPVLREACREFHRLLSPSGRLVIKQSFLPPGQQKYGTDIVSKPADLVRFVQGAKLEVEREILLIESSGERMIIVSALQARA